MPDQTDASYFAYAFEAKSIQTYLLSGGKLRDIVGASDLLDALCDGPDAILDGAMATCGLSDKDFTRRAAGAIIVHCEKRKVLEAFRALWTLVFQQHLPGMDFADALGEGASANAAIKGATGKLVAARNRLAPLVPLSSPLSQLSPRTGGPAVEISKIDGTSIDEATARRRHRTLVGPAVRDRLAKRFASDTMRNNSAKSYVWPKNLDAVDAADDSDEKAFLAPGENATIGVVHIDGSGIGKILLDLRQKLERRQDAGPIFRAFSDAIASAMQISVQHAVDTILEPATIQSTDQSGRVIDIIPARPIVLAGDDVTIIVRGDLAIEFAEAAIAKFGEVSRITLEKLWKDTKLDSKDLGTQLSAGGGIAFVQAKQPYDRAYRLAEDIAAYAKGVAKSLAKDKGEALPDGVLAFHRMTTSMFGLYEQDVIERELTVTVDSTDKRLTAMPYTISSSSNDRPKLTDLRTLKDLLVEDQLSRGPL
ncbi:MAG: hypothetical protein HOO99_11960, partial [Hyphomicrobiaceae bacterium]|nr:hypothetical protein [Hyphomicrobiaceae bacterium]